MSFTHDDLALFAQLDWNLARGKDIVQGVLHIKLRYWPCLGRTSPRTECCRSASFWKCADIPSCLSANPLGVKDKRHQNSLMKNVAFNLPCGSTKTRRFCLFLLLFKPFR